MKADKNGNISVDQLKTFVLTCCKDEMINKHLSKKDIEGFLSAFIYNQYGNTNVKEIVPIVFANENYISKKLQHRIRGNPPPPEVNGDLDLYEVTGDEIHNHEVERVLKQMEEKIFDGPIKMY